jgi:hypothetical protein
MDSTRDDSKRSKLESTELAELIVDALLRAGLLKSSDTVNAVEITAEEIEVRKMLGDY